MKTGLSPAPGGGADRAPRPLARGRGVPVERDTPAEEFAASLKRGFGEPGPLLIACAVPALA
ncbi:hypothetical protein [Streptomyces sp. NPDC017988]|uniref:hypothetical protein n=1 Tax=Streptomyces sp. NPDC017988 TaxID=3365025 RepID=UPI00379B8EF9